MMTNIIAYLHTTLAYQSAALQLMVGQANFDAQQLHMAEPLPVVAPASTNDWIVAMPPAGVTGRLSTSNYIYQFQQGKLLAITQRPRPRGVAANSAETQPSLIDANGAYQLAAQFLAGISVDVPALESKYPHRVTQLGFRPPSVRNRAIATNSVKSPVLQSPIFRVSWGAMRSPQSAATGLALQASVEILGSTKQCIGLHIHNPELLRNPPLQVTNVAALLGTPPPPRHFVEEFLGGPAAYAAVAQPDTVTAWLLTSAPDDPDSKTNRTPPVAVNAATASLFSKTLTDFNSYSWLDEKSCAPDYDVRLRFSKGAETVEFLLCFECDSLQVTHNGEPVQKDFDPAHAALVRAIQAVFPADNAIKNLSLYSQPR